MVLAGGWPPPLEPERPLARGKAAHQGEPGPTTLDVEEVMDRAVDLLLRRLRIRRRRAPEQALEAAMPPVVILADGSHGEPVTYGTCVIEIRKARRLSCRVVGIENVVKFDADILKV